ncbi:MAG: TetR/AcrR family transcriptional regulator [Corallococcus sp.]|nr:TetR/AcrR family transcriptional regulator [Corallococcus sp.]MCM1359165.1 TetR/AcrR family transcriptional regulator [Corallococcus sp.]MCM1394555.1 TetR/AcrR family transcriptional regulator [Corallococcus sp.]
MTVRDTKGLIEHNQNLNKQITEYLQQALILLLEKKSLEEISITELCNKAGVSRMAFYSNYKSKAELYEQIVHTLNKDMIDVVGSPFTKTVGLEWYENFFALMAENFETVKTVIGADRNRYYSAINSVVMFTRPLSEEQKLVRLIWTGGMVNATLHWVDTDMQESAENIAKLCYYSLKSALHCYSTM